VKKLKIKNCKECPFLVVERTMGAGCATDWLCGKTKRKNSKIAGYIEWPSEEPKEIPNWCPLEDWSKK